MRPKIEIDEAMVERAYREMTSVWGDLKNDQTRAEARAIVEAALNPPTYAKVL